MARLRVLLLASLAWFGCGEEAEEVELLPQPTTGGEAAPSPADPATLTALVVDSQRAGFERHDVAAYLAPWAEDSQLVIGRSAEPGEHDTTWNYSHLVESRRMRFAGDPVEGRQMRHENIDVQIQGDEAVLRCRTITESPGASEVVDEIYWLRPGTRGWQIARNYAWPVSVTRRDSEIVYDETTWAELDAAVERARPADRVLRLLDAWRYQEAYETAHALAGSNNATASAQQMLGSLAVMLGEREVAARAYWAARGLNSDLEMPLWLAE